MWHFTHDTKWICGRIVHRIDTKDFSIFPFWTIKNWKKLNQRQSKKSINATRTRSEHYILRSYFVRLWLATHTHTHDEEVNPIFTHDHTSITPRCTSHYYSLSRLLHQSNTPCSFPFIDHRRDRNISSFHHHHSIHLFYKTTRDKNVLCVYSLFIIIWITYVGRKRRWREPLDWKLNSMTCQTPSESIGSFARHNNKINPAMRCMCVVCECYTVFNGLCEWSMYDKCCCCSCGAP